MSKGHALRPTRGPSRRGHGHPRIVCGCAHPLRAATRRHGEPAAELVVRRMHELSKRRETRSEAMERASVQVCLADVKLEGELILPEQVPALVIATQPVNDRYARAFAAADIGTLTLELRPIHEQVAADRRPPPDFRQLAGRLSGVTDWYLATCGRAVPIGYLAHN